MDEKDVGPAHVGGWVSWLDGQIEAAAASMSAELGDATACRVHKDGRVTGGLKYHEGRMTAFAEAKRLSGHAAGDLENALTRFEHRWAEELAQRSSAARPSPPWVAYATGGAEAAQEVSRAFRSGR